MSGHSICSNHDMACTLLRCRQPDCFFGSTANNTTETSKKKTFGPWPARYVACFVQQRKHHSMNLTICRRFQGLPSHLQLDGASCYRHLYHNCTILITIWIVRCMCLLTSHWFSWYHCDQNGDHPAYALTTVLSDSKLPLTNTPIGQQNCPAFSYSSATPDL